jgi:hypothetical protein
MPNNVVAATCWDRELCFPCHPALWEGDLSPLVEFLSTHLALFGSLGYKGKVISFLWPAAVSDRVQVLPLGSLSCVDMVLVAASPRIDRDSFLLPSPGDWHAPLTHICQPVP